MFPAKTILPVAPVAPPLMSPASYSALFAPAGVPGVDDDKEEEGPARKKLREAKPLVMEVPSSKQVHLIKITSPR